MAAEPLLSVILPAHNEAENIPKMARRLAEVLTAAVRDAHARALVMAEAAGATMLEFVQLADPGLLGGSEPPVLAPLGDQMRAMRMGSEAPFVSELSITLEPDLLELTEQVHARFRA